MESELNKVDCNLEIWLAKQDIKFFPEGENYNLVYENIKDALKPYHEEVEKGALFADIKIFISAHASNKEFIEPISYLNNHGIKHVQKVIEKASDLLEKFQCEITPYEGFVLLCSIHFHDVGNVLGRTHHERKCQSIMEEIKPKLDRIEQNTIIKLAYAHSGYIENSDNDRDKISKLKQVANIKTKKVRKRFFAAILRLADELADDSSRASKVMLGFEDMLGSSEVYHVYSQSLHTVLVQRNEIILEYHFEPGHVLKKLKKGRKSCYLLDEIYSRTLKMYRELNYCMRFVRPNISIDRINVKITIQKENSLEELPINYVLEEKGYPAFVSNNIKSFYPEMKTGLELKKYWQGGEL